MHHLPSNTAQSSLICSGLALPHAAQIPTCLSRHARSPSCIGDAATVVDLLAPPPATTRYNLYPTRAFFSPRAGDAMASGSPLRCRRYGIVSGNSPCAKAHGTGRSVPRFALNRWSPAKVSQSELAECCASTTYHLSRCPPITATFHVKLSPRELYAPPTRTDFCFWCVDTSSPCSQASCCSAF